LSPLLCAVVEFHYRGWQLGDVRYGLNLDKGYVGRDIFLKDKKERRIYDLND